jgi:hypothetical protein
MKKLLGAVFACLTAIGTVQGAIIDHGNFLTDTTTGLDWLDVTKTVNMSYNDVMAQLGFGGTYEGWRYATGSDFNRLVGGYTGIAIDAPNVRINQEPNKIDGLVVLLGSTLDTYFVHLYGQTYDAMNGYPEGAYHDNTIGFTSDAYDGNGIYTAILVDSEEKNSDGSEYTDFSMANYTYVDRTVRNYQIGSFLVRGNSVPEPSTILLILAASLGLVAARVGRRAFAQ